MCSKPIIIFTIKNQIFIRPIYTRRITPKRVTGDGVRLSGLAPGQHSSKETSQRWRFAGDAVFDLTGPGIEPHVSRTDNNVLITELTGRLCY